MGEMKLAVVGAGGRMGRNLARAAHEMEGCELVGGVERAGSEYVGCDLGELAGLGRLGVEIGDDAPALFASGIDGVLDFTTPAASVQFSELAAQARIVHIIGTTGFKADDEQKIKAASRHAAIVKAGNMSLGINMLTALVEQVANALDESFDIEIVEMHHRHKVDAPSGTALMLGEAAAGGRGVSLEEKSVRSRDGHTGERRAGDIGFATLRGGSVVGEHKVIFAGNAERIELSHIADDRGIFATGAVKAALWAKDRKPGLYSMKDVLGLS
jgi:4-hydroxy-tetrahydrodipicolinate reductase